MYLWPAPDSQRLSIPPLPLECHHTWQKYLNSVLTLLCGKSWREKLTHFPRKTRSFAYEGKGYAFYIIALFIIFPTFYHYFLEITKGEILINK